MKSNSPPESNAFDTLRAASGVTAGVGAALARCGASIRWCFWVASEEESRVGSAIHPAFVCRFGVSAMGRCFMASVGRWPAVFGLPR